ncbi:MAG TPA: hypothetical protein VN837_05475 [Chloroflexota bacterium]|nr:hypothetical protein [Chloroflexota bacterium]
MNTAEIETAILNLRGGWPGNPLLSILQAVRCIGELSTSTEERLRMLAVGIRQNEAARLAQIRAAWERTGPRDAAHEEIFAYLASELEEPA